MVLKVLVLVVLTVLTVPRAVLRAQAPAAAGGTIDPRIVKLVASVSEERLQQLLQKLSSFKTRNSCSDPSAPDGVGAARQWIFDELKRTSPKLQVSFDTHMVQTVRGCITRDGRVPERDGDPARQDAAPDLRQRPLRLGESRRRRPADAATRVRAARRCGQARPGAAAPPATRPGAAPQAPGEPADPQAAAPRQICDHRLPAPGANDDGSGTVLSMELARVFAESGIEFDATLVFMTVAGRRAGAGRRRRAREDGARRRTSRSRPGSTTTSSAAPAAATAPSTARPSASIRKGRKTRRHARSRVFAQRIAAQYVPSHQHPADGPPRSVQPRRRSQRAQRAGVRRDRLPRVARELLEAARRRRHDRRRRFPLSGAERARQRRRRWPTLALAPPPPVVVTTARRADHRSPSVRLRRAPALGRLTRRGRLSHLLAQRLGPRLGARSRRRQRDRVHVPAHEHRRLGVRRRRGGCRGSREHRQRLRRAASHTTAD